jgi:hypothetical protein
MEENFGRAWDLLTYPRHFLDSLGRLALKLVPTPPTQSAPPDPDYVDPQQLMVPNVGSYCDPILEKESDATDERIPGVRQPFQRRL